MPSSARQAFSISVFSGRSAKSLFFSLQSSSLVNELRGNSQSTDGTQLELSGNSQSTDDTQLNLSRISEASETKDSHNVKKSRVSIISKLEHKMNTGFYKIGRPGKTFFAKYTGHGG